MSRRELPARPDLDHLKREAKALLKSFDSGDTGAIERVHDILGARAAIKLTEAQRVIAREYGFENWAALRAHVLTSRGAADAVDAFLNAIMNHDASTMASIMSAHPHLPRESLHIAAVLGSINDVRDILRDDPSQLSARRGPVRAEPLFWLCHSPFHAESTQRDDAFFACAQALLDAGANPNTRDERYGVSALYAVTGVNNSTRIAKLLLDAGADPNDGESVFHAAEKYHVEALELLMQHGAQLNAVGDWGNTPLYFLLRYFDVEKDVRVKQGVMWLLDHGADPNVRCGKEQETSLHAAIRRNQHYDIVKLLVDHGADISLRTANGRTPWNLARRHGRDDVVRLLEAFGAKPEPLTPQDALLDTCARGDAITAGTLRNADVIAALDIDDLRMMIDAAIRGAAPVVSACLAAGFPVNTVDDFGATALHHAAIQGHADIVQELLRHGADHTIEDREHTATPLGWACFGADYVSNADGDYVATVKALVSGGAKPSPNANLPAHEGVRAVLSESGSG